MRMLRLIAVLAIAVSAAACNEPCAGEDTCRAGIDAHLPSPDLGCAGDLAGTPRQICGQPDASFQPSRCGCVGDP